MARYRVRFYTDYEVEAPTKETALKLAEKKLNNEMCNGWFSLDDYIVTKCSDSGIVSYSDIEKPQPISDRKREILNRILKGGAK